MIDINVTLFIQMANFLVFLFLMNIVLYRPIRRIVAERKSLMAKKQEGADLLEAQSVAAAQNFELSLQESRRLGFQKIQDLKVAGYEQEKEILGRISEEAAASLQQMRAKIKTDINAARKELKSQVRSFSTELAQKILGRKI